MRSRLAFALVLLLAGCSGGGGATSVTSAAAKTQPAAQVVDFQRLAADEATRRAGYLQAEVAGWNGMGEGQFTQIARLELNQGPLSRAAIEYSLDQMDQRQDTADFGCAGFVRIVYQYGNSALIPSDLRARMDRSLQGFKYWVDEPGQDQMTFWSENHQILFASNEYLAGSFYPTATFPNANMTGADHATKAKARILRWLDQRTRFGMSEWNSPVYYEYDIMPLLNLVDFAPDAEIRARAAVVVDLIFFDLARLTNQGSFGVTAGRIYEEMKFSGHGQSVGDTIEILFGTRGQWESRSSPSATCLATSRGYKVPWVLLGIGRDKPDHLVDRTRMGLSFAEGATIGLGFTSFDDGIAWWGMGGYTASQTIVLSRDMISRWNLWSYPLFQVFQATQSIPDSILPSLADQLSVITEGMVLSTANNTTYRTPEAMLSSVQSFRRGQVGYQQHAWQATLGMDAICFTTSPGTFGRDGVGEWTGSGSMPRVVQVGNVALILYNPALAQKMIFPHQSHAFFPKAAFDEFATQGPWSFARKGQGYVGLYSAQPTSWTAQGTFADRELVADGDRNIWICQVGRAADDGSFADFQTKVMSGAVVAQGGGNQDQSVPLSVTYAATGVGTFSVDWSGTPTLSGIPIQDDFPRYDNPYAQVPLGARQIQLRFAGATLSQDHDLATRTGDGL